MAKRIKQYLDYIEEILKREIWILSMSRENI